VCAGGVDVVRVGGLLTFLETNHIYLAVVVETWFRDRYYEEDLKVFVLVRGWQWFGRRRLERNCKEIRGSGGVGMLVKESWGVGKLIKTTCNGLVGVRLVRGGLVRAFFGVYAVPMTSGRRDHNSRLFEELERIVGVCQGSGEEVIVLGDFNSRIGSLESVIGDSEFKWDRLVRVF
jgi:hypothetical protein